MDSRRESLMTTQQERAKTFCSETLQGALAAVKEAYGPRAFIVETRQVQKGGFLGLNRRTLVEVVACPEGTSSARTTRPAPLQPLQPPVSGNELQRAYAQLRRKTHRSLQQVDALLTPTTPLAALPVGEVDREDTYTRINGLCLRNTTAVNLLGLCALSLPCGFTRSGLPIGLQLVGRPWTEARLLLLAHAYEQATPWLRQHPRVEAFG